MFQIIASCFDLTCKLLIVKHDNVVVYPGPLLASATCTSLLVVGRTIEPKMIHRLLINTNIGDRKENRV